MLNTIIYIYIIYNLYVSILSIIYIEYKREARNLTERGEQNKIGWSPLSKIHRDDRRAKRSVKSVSRLFRAGRTEGECRKGNETRKIPPSSPVQWWMRPGVCVFESIRYVTLRLDLRLSTVPEWLAVMCRADRELWWCWRCSALLPRPRLPPALTVLIGRPPLLLFLGTTSSWLLHTHAHHATCTPFCWPLILTDFYAHTLWWHRGHTHVRHVLQRTSLLASFFYFLSLFSIFLFQFDRVSSREWVGLCSVSLRGSLVEGVAGEHVPRRKSRCVFEIL